MLALSPAANAVAPVASPLFPAVQTASATPFPSATRFNARPGAVFRYRRAEEPSRLTDIGGSRSNASARDADSAARAESPAGHSDNAIRRGHGGHAHRAGRTHDTEQQEHITHRKAENALRDYFKETRPALKRQARRDLFADPGRMIAYLHEDLDGMSASPPISASAPSHAWEARDCLDAGKLDLLLSHAGSESPDPASRMPMLRGLLQRFIELPLESELFSIAGYDFLLAARLLKPVAAVRDEFKAHLLEIFPSLIEHADAAHWLTCQLLERFDPALLRPDLEDLWYGSAQFALLQSDIHVAISADLYKSWMGSREIGDTADAIRDVLSVGGIPRHEVFIPQSAPALLYAHTAQFINLRQPATPGAHAIALQALNKLQVERRKRQFAPLEKASADLKTAPPMRGKIAERLLHGIGADPAAEGSAWLEIDSCVGQTKTLLQFYLDGCDGSARELLPAGGSKILPDLEQAYRAAFGGWYANYENALAVLLQYAVEELHPDDYLFWRNNPVDLLQATMTATRLIPYVSPTFSGDPSNTKDVTLRGNASLLFAAKQGAAKRYYQISLGDRSVAVIRRIKPRDLNTYIDDHGAQFFDAEALAENTERALRTRAGVRLLAAFPAGEPTLRFRETAAWLASFVRQEIHDFGYERTGHRKTMEQIQSFLLGFIPGYDCVSAIRAERHEEAVVPCVIDGYSIVLPLASRFVKTGLALAGMAPQALTFAASREIGGMLAKHGAWKTAGAVAGRMQQPLAAIGKDFAYGLGKDLLRIGDPGFEMMYQLHGQARKFSSLAQRIFADRRVARKLNRLLRRNPHTQHAAGLMRKQRRRARLNGHPVAQGGAALPARYEGKTASDAGGEFFRFDLPPGAKVHPMPYLKYETPYNGLDESIELYDIDGGIFARERDTPHVLENAGKLLREQAHCRLRRGAGNAACVFVEELACDPLAPAAGYRFDFGKSGRRVYQYDPDTQKKIFSTPVVETYPFPVTITGKSRRIILMPEDAYELKATRAGVLKAESIGDRFNKFSLEAPDTLLPATGRLVARTDPAGGGSGSGLAAVEFTLKNGIAKCRIRANYGTYPAIDGNGNLVYRGMIRLDDAYVRIDFPSGAGNNIVSLAEAEASEIDAYRRFQIESLVEHDRRASAVRFPMELNRTSAGTLLRLYKRLDLTLYRNLLDEIASLPGQDSLRAARALDAYIEDPAKTADIAAFGEIKSHFDALLRDQFHSYDSVRRFEQYLTAAINRHPERLDMHLLDMASPRVDETMATLAKLFPGTAAARGKYMEQLALHARPNGETLRGATVAHLRKILYGRNVAYAEVHRLRNGVPTLEKTYFSVSGRQQINDRRAHLRIATIEADAQHVDADQAFVGRPGQPRDAGEAGADLSHSFPDFDDKGRERWRGDDSEYKILSAIRLDPENLDEPKIIKMVTLLPPCVMCRQALAMFSQEFPKARLEVAYLKQSRYERIGQNAKAAGASSWSRQHGVSRVRRFTDGFTGNPATI